MGARLPRRLKIDRPIAAYIVTGFASTAVVAVASCFVILSGMMIRGHAEGFRLVSFVLGGTTAWIGISVVGLIVAWPFVLAATWIGERLNFESPAYYPMAGGISMSGLLLVLVGLPRLPRPEDFGLIPAGLWPLGLGCAVSWGICWWFLHRRWKAAIGGRQTPR